MGRGLVIGFLEGAQTPLPAVARFGRGLRAGGLSRCDIAFLVAGRPALAFFADGKLKKIPASGGRPEDLCVAPFALVGTWGLDGSILFARLDPPGIYRVPDAGGEPVRIIAPDASRREVNLIWPHFLPDGRRFLYLANRAPGAGDRELRVASLDSKENHSVARSSSRVEYVAPGYLLYGRDGALFAQPFDQRIARLHGEPRQLASNIYYFFGPSHAVFSASQTGVIAYQTAAPTSRLTWFTRDGKEVGQLGEPSLVRGIRISPDATIVAMDIRNDQIGNSTSGLPSSDVVSPRAFIRIPWTRSCPSVGLPTGPD